MRFYCVKKKKTSIYICKTIITDPDKKKCCDKETASLQMKNLIRKYKLKTNGVAESEQKNVSKGQFGHRKNTSTVLNF